MVHLGRSTCDAISGPLSRGGRGADEAGVGARDNLPLGQIPDICLSISLSLRRCLSVFLSVSVSLSLCLSVSLSLSLGLSVSRSLLSLSHGAGGKQTRLAWTRLPWAVESICRDGPFRIRTKHHTVKAKSWPWPPEKGPLNLLGCSFFVWKRGGNMDRS